MSKRIYTDYIEDIFNSIEEAVEFTKEMKYQEFVNDRKTANAVIRSLEVLGEAAKNVPPEIRNKYPEIPWRKMAGMRDKLLHEYFGVDLEIVWQVVQKDLSIIKPLIEDLLGEHEKQEIGSK